MAISVQMKKLLMAAVGGVFIALGAAGKAEALTLNGSGVNPSPNEVDDFHFSFTPRAVRLPVTSNSAIAFGSWYQFSFSDVGENAQGCYPADPLAGSCTPSFAGNSTFAGPSPWTFEVPAAGAILKVTDAFFRGDAFDIYNFDILIGNTSTPVLGGGCGNNPDNCFADPLVSKSTFQLAAGQYSLRIVPNASPFGRGAAYFRVDQAKEVPEPALILGLLAFGVMGIATKRDR